MQVFKVYSPEKLAKFVDPFPSNSFTEKAKKEFSDGECNINIIEGCYQTALDNLREKEKSPFLSNTILEKLGFYYKLYKINFLC